MILEKGMKKETGRKQNLRKEKPLMQKLAPVLVLAAGILWGTMGIFVRRLNRAGLASPEIVALRAMVTCAALFLFLLVYDRKLLKIRLKDIWCFLGTGICSIVFFNYCYFKAITMTSLSVAAVLLYTAPAMVMVMSRFLFHERFTGIRVLALILTFLGCVLVTGIAGSGDALSPAGILVGLGAGFGYALYSIFGKFAIERGYDSFTISFYTFLAASVGILPLTDVKLLGNVVFRDGSMILFALVFGLASTVLPYLTYTIGLKYMENSKASIIASVEPVVATLLGIVVYHESMTAGGLLGVVLVLFSIVICQREPETAPD
ncbi:MAG: DMT family transporter [Lachnospiraceae bacterium]